MKGGQKDKAISFHKIQLSLVSALTFLDGQRDRPECKEALPSPLRPCCSHIHRDPSHPPPQPAVMLRLQQELVPTAQAPETVSVSL